MKETTCSFQHFYSLRTSHVFTAYTFAGKTSVVFHTGLSNCIDKWKDEIFLQDSNLLLLSSTSGRSYSRSGRNLLYPDLAVDKYKKKTFGYIEHYFVTRPAKIWDESKFENYSVRKKVLSLQSLRFGVTTNRKRVGSNASIEWLNSTKSRPYSTCVTMETVKNRRTVKTTICCDDNRPFARSGHMVRKKLHWDANYAVGLPKQRNLHQSSPTFLCFESPTA